MSDAVATVFSSPLQIAVLGMGGIGSTFAFQLARTGQHTVTAIARAGSVRYTQLRRDEGIINDRNERAAVLVTDALDETCAYDLVLVTLLAHQVESVLSVLQRSRAKRIQFMFNNFDPARLRDALGAERCSFGMPFVQATIDRQGRLHATIGAPGQKCKMNDQRWVDLFNTAGVPSVFEPEMLLWLRCHVPLCIAFESVSVCAIRRGKGASWGEAMVLARGAHECFMLIERLESRIYPSGKLLLYRSPVGVMASVLWSMSRIRSFRELLSTGVGECRALVDVVARASVGVLRPDSVARIEAMKP